MGVIARVVGVAACGLSLAVLAAAPTAGAEPTGALPPMTSSGSGPVIGDGDAALRQRISQQLFSFGDPTVQEVDGSDAAQFITAAAAVADRDVASVFLPLQRVLGCQQNTAGSGAGFGARAYRRTDGQWGGAMLVVAKSTVSDVDALKACVKSGWRKATAGTPTSMCNNGWTYPPFADTRRGEEGYFVLLAGTVSDFCSAPNANYRTTASHGRASRPADRGGPLVGPYGPPGRSQNATHNAQAGIDTHCSCPSAVRSQYIGPGFPQSFAPSGEHG